MLLAASSIVFYAFGQLTYVPLFLTSILINYVSGILLTHSRKYRRLILALSVFLNIGILGIFKYTDFIIANLNRAFSLSLPYAGIVLTMRF